ncbi:hypothetical protein JL722_4751 [Aureococcus anophagefferens]|nr:hypothetical protein JL722_4751 [Aureococcus anophagefferens]
MRARGCEASSAAVLLANCAFLLKLLLASPALLAWLLLRCWSWLTNALSKATASLARPVMAGLAEAFDAVLSEAPDGARWGGRPARPSAMQRAYDDASARMARGFAPRVGRGARR